VSPKLRKLGLVGGLAALCGCELVAGIQDLQLAPYMEPVEASVAGNDSGTEPDATVNADAESSSSEPQTSSESGGFEADANWPNDASEAAAPEDAASDSGTGEAGTSTVDGSSEVADAAVDAADATSGITGTVLIDDMENDGNLGVGWLDGPNLKGTWFVFDDGTAGGVLTPPQGSPAALVISLIPGGRGSSVHAAHVVGSSGFTAYGAGMGFDLNAPSSATVGAFDASAYSGFTFWARALGDAGVTDVTFNVLDRNTAPISSGGTCDGGACSGYYGKNLQLTSAWQEFMVLYADLERPVWAIEDGLAFDPTHMIGCEFQVAQGQAFDLWVDDIYFLK
jgi:hypothetical protein